MTRTYLYRRNGGCPLYRWLVSGAWKPRENGRKRGGKRRSGRTKCTPLTRSFRIDILVSSYSTATIVPGIFDWIMPKGGFGKLPWLSTNFSGIDFFVMEQFEPVPRRFDIHVPLESNEESLVAGAIQQKWNPRRRKTHVINGAAREKICSHEIWYSCGLATVDANHVLGTIVEPCSPRRNRSFKSRFLRI